MLEYVQLIPTESCMFLTEITIEYIVLFSISTFKKFEGNHFLGWFIVSIRWVTFYKALQ